MTPSFPTRRASGRQLADPGRVRVGGEGAVVGRRGVESRRVQRSEQRRPVDGAGDAAHAPQQVRLGPLADDLPPTDHHDVVGDDLDLAKRSEEHTSELQSLMRISYAVFCLKK